MRLQVNIFALRNVLAFFYGEICTIAVTNFNDKYAYKAYLKGRTCYTS
jgi:hypothetical protein